MQPAAPVPAFAGPLTSALEAAQRAAVVREARAWEGTPYRQLGDTRGAGVDCCMLLVRCWVDAGVVAPFDPRPYPPEWFLHREEERYLAWVQLAAEEVAAPQVGDIALYRFGRCFAHGAIVVAPGVVVHAVAPLGTCTASDMHESWLAWCNDAGTRPRPVRFFDPWARLRRLAVAEAA